MTLTTTEQRIATEAVRVRLDLGPLTQLSHVRRALLDLEVALAGAQRVGIASELAAARPDEERTIGLPADRVIWISYANPVDVALFVGSPVVALTLVKLLSIARDWHADRSEAMARARAAEESTRTQVILNDALERSLATDHPDLAKLAHLAVGARETESLRRLGELSPEAVVQSMAEARTDAPTVPPLPSSEGSA